MRITKRQLRRIIKEEASRLSENQNAERMQGLYADTAAIEALQMAFDDLLAGAEMSAASDFGEGDKSGYHEAAEAAVTLTVARVFEEAGLQAQAYALMRTLR